MSAEIIPFDFEEQAVRIAMRGDDPWFVAADVCRVLEIGNTSQAITRLDEDEVTLITNEGSHRPLNLINESGLYALVLTSRKDQAKRFRKWITSEVLPAIRRHGRYDHALPEASAPATGDIAGLPIREAELWLQMVREARLTRGARAAVSIWGRSPLPPIGEGAGQRGDLANGRACLRHILSRAAGAIAAARDGCSEIGANALSEMLLRATDEGLFVANLPLDLFEGTRWAGGAHREALLSLDGVMPQGPRTLRGVKTRGVLVPWAHMMQEVA